MGMTIDEAILQLEECKAYKQCDTEKDLNAFDVAITTMRKYQKLEQEPTTKNDLGVDAISREQALSELKESAEHHANDSREETLLRRDRDIIRALPPVTPRAKSGRWITWKEAGNEIPSETRFECSVCHDAAQTLCNGLDLLSAYCPNCGARMESEET